jgi:hypothetical protein
MLSRAGATLLHVAAACHRHEIGAFLLSRGYDACVRDKYGRTPLHYSARSRNLHSDGEDKYTAAWVELKDPLRRLSAKPDVRSFRCSVLLENCNGVAPLDMCRGCRLRFEFFREKQRMGRSTKSTRSFQRARQVDDGHGQRGLDGSDEDPPSYRCICRSSLFSAAVDAGLRLSMLLVPDAVRLSKAPHGVLGALKCREDDGKVGFGDLPLEIRVDICFRICVASWCLSEEFV